MPVHTPILHVDLDAFFASVEQLDDPRLRGKPVIVGGLGNRGVVSAASYEARPYGVHSAMPMARARRACPHAVFLSPRMPRYVEKSRGVMAILGEVTPLVEQLSVDEAFLDVGGAHRLLGEPIKVAELIRTRIHDETGLTASIGVASSKFLAKVASELAKPDGLLAVRAGEERTFLAPLPVRRLWGVGPATLPRLARMGLRTIGDVAALDRELLEHALGSSLGAHLHALAHNEDTRAVVPDRDAKSVGAEETFASDLRTRDACERELVGLADRVCSRLRHRGLTARTVTLKIRFGDFETRTRARTLGETTAVSTVVFETARALIDEFDPARGVRLLGVSCSQLAPIDDSPVVQPMLAFDDDASVYRERAERRAAVERAVDGVRARFGIAAVDAGEVDRPHAGGAGMIRVGLVGCGHIGTVHAVALQQLASAQLVDAQLARTYDADPDRAAKVARRHGGEPAASVGALLDAVDAVWICTWTAAHADAVEAAADRGVPIFCEKPLAPNLPDAARVTRALERVPHQVGLVLRWAPVFQGFAARVSSGEFGRVLATSMRDDQYYPTQGMYGSTWRRDVACAGGGTLIEHSIHDVDVLRWLLGEPAAVSAHTACRFGHDRIEDSAAVRFVYADGSVAQLTSVWHQVLSRESSRRLEVFCEKALLWTDDDYLGPLHVQTDDGTTTIEAAPPAWTSRLTVPEVYAKALAQYAEPSKAFLDALSEGRSPAGHPPASEALAAHRLVDAAYRSAASGGAPLSAS